MRVPTGQMLGANRLHFEWNERVPAENLLIAPITEPLAVRESDQRSHGRSNVFLTAMLDSGAIRVPVRIRNLSANGALVEASNLPPLGAKICLMRGDLSARGTLAWADAGHAGISFEAEIEVAAWVRRIGHAGQQRVDSLVDALRSSAPLSPDRQGGAFAKSVAEISASLDKLCEDLAGSATMSLELGEQLLKLDSIAHALRQVASGRSS